MDDIRIELDVGMAEARWLLSETAVKGFWPKLKAYRRGVAAPTDWDALPAYAVRFCEGDRFVLEELGAGLGRWTKGYHMLDGRLEEHGPCTVLRATSTLQTWRAFSVRYRVLWLLALLPGVWPWCRLGAYGAGIFGALMGVVAAVFIFENIFFAGRDRRAFARMVEAIFEGHVVSPSEGSACEGIAIGPRNSGAVGAV